MLKFLVNLRAHKLFGCGVVLTLCLAGCEQPQAVPISLAPAPNPAIQPDRYYLNAQASTKEAIEQLDSKTIARVDVLKGQQAADYAHNTSVSGVILVRTR